MERVPITSQVRLPGLGGSLQDLLQPAGGILDLDGAPGFADEHVQAAPAPERGVGRQVTIGHRRWLAVQGHIEAGRPALDQLALGSVQVVTNAGELFGFRAKQFDGEIHGLRPVAPDESPDDGVAVEAAQQVFPDPGESLLRLTGVERHGIVAAQVQVQARPIRGACFDEQEAFEREDDVQFVHEIGFETGWSGSGFIHLVVDSSRPCGIGNGEDRAPPGHDSYPIRSRRYW